MALGDGFENRELAETGLEIRHKEDGVTGCSVVFAGVSDLLDH